MYGDIRGWRILWIDHDQDLNQQKVKHHDQVYPEALSQSEEQMTDTLTELLRSGARELIVQAVEAGLQVLLEQHAEHRLPDGRKAVVRNGYLPERTVQTGIGDVEVKVLKVRDRSGSGFRFNSSIPEAVSECRGAAALAVSEGCEHGRLPGCAGLITGRSGQGSFRQHDQSVEAAFRAFDRALVRFESKYPGAMARLRKDRD